MKHKKSLREKVADRQKFRARMRKYIFTAILLEMYIYWTKPATKKELEAHRDTLRQDYPDFHDSCSY